ncbi:MAG: adenylate/guanylate cyclase domain-containing protein [Bacteroidota bacterium]
MSKQTSSDLNPMQTLSGTLGEDDRRRWAEEYKRLGRKYATWGAVFAIIGGPSILLTEMHNNYADPSLWLFFRLLPAVAISIAYLLFRFLRWSHEFLFVVIAYSLFTCYAYWPDCQAPDKFLFGQLTMLIPAAFITMLRPVILPVNIVVQLVLIVVFNRIFCPESNWEFFSSQAFLAIIVASISSYMVASFRYYLARYNFLLNTRLQAALAQAEESRKKSDELLKNILPEEIAEELKEQGNSAARSYDLVTILFTDFKDFTSLSQEMNAIDLVNEIDANFQAFDAICERHGIEKIKTIGDAYMAASGLPIPTTDAAKRAVLAAIEMQAFVEGHMEQRRKEGKPCFAMRVGIHTGPVVAGIVGVKKFQYDIWGDTVNTASRMESSSESGKVNISQATYEHIARDPDFRFTPRGKIAVKGKGEVEMYFVELAGKA